MQLPDNIQVFLRTYKSSNAQEVFFYNTELNKGISFDANYLYSSPYLLGLVEEIALPSLDSLDKDLMKEVLVNSVEKRKINTIHDGLIEMRIIKDDIYKRFKQVLEMYCQSQEQLEAITNSISRLVVGVRKIPIIAKTMENKTGIVNKQYFEEKFNYVTQLLEEGTWEISGFDYMPEGTYCELGHEIKKVVYLEDTFNGFQLQFGVQCIQDVVALTDEQSREIENMFETYRRYIIEYTYMLETMTYSPKLDYSKFIAIQNEALLLLQNSYQKNISSSINQGLRQNKRRELEENEPSNTMTIQRYTHLINLTRNDIPLLPSQVSDFFNFDIKETGIYDLGRFLSNVFPESDKMAQAVFRALLGQHCPLFVYTDNDKKKKPKQLSEVKSGEPVSVLGYPVSIKDYKNYYTQYQELVTQQRKQLTPTLDDDEYIKLVLGGLEFTDTLNKITYFISQLNQEYSVKGGNSLTGAKVVYTSEMGYSTKIPLAYILEEQLKLKKTMKLTTLLKKYSDLSYSNDTRDIIEDYCNSSKLRLATGEVVKIYNYTDLITIATETDNPKECISRYEPNVNIDLQELTRGIIDAPYNERLELTRKDYVVAKMDNLSEYVRGLTNLYQQYFAPYDPKKVTMLTKRETSLIALGLTSTLMGQDVNKNPEDMDDELFEHKQEVVSFVMEHLKQAYIKLVANNKEVQAKLDAEQNKFSSPDPKVNVTEAIEMLEPKEVMDKYKSVYRSDSLTIEDVRPLVEYEPSTNTRTLTKQTLEAFALKTLVNNESITLDSAEIRGTNFILDKILPDIKTRTGTLSPKMAQYGSDTIHSVLEKRLDEQNN